MELPPNIMMGLSIEQLHGNRISFINGEGVGRIKSKSKKKCWEGKITFSEWLGFLKIGIRENKDSGTMIMSKKMVNLNERSVGGIPVFIFVPQAAISDQERKKMKRKGDRYSMQTSLIVAALKRLLPIGLNICAPGDHELIALAKNRFSLVSLLATQGW